MFDELLTTFFQEKCILNMHKVFVYLFFPDFPVTTPNNSFKIIKMSDSNGFDSSTGKDSLGFTKGYYSKSTKIGIIADIQYADVEDGSNFDKSETRG